MSKRIGLLTAVFVLAFPALASAKIVVNKSIAGVSLGATKAAVHAHLGKPTLDPKFPHDWFYPRLKLLVTFKNSRVIELFTESAGQKTASGIGVGSKESAVKARIKGVLCQHVAGAKGQECITFRPHGPNDWVTDFHVNPRGRVSSVLVNIMPAGGALDRALRVHS